MAKVRRYHPNFADDLTAATGYYDRVSQSLGLRFREIVVARLDAIADRPDSFAKLQGEIRACSLTRFPYVILFELHAEFVVMLGIYHAASDRAGWFERATD